jgi:hypothetical protein
VGRALALILGIGSAAFALGCGGGAPLLHGAHALEPGRTANGVGFSGTFTTGVSRDAVDAARGTIPPAADRVEIHAKEGAVRAAMAPGVAPWAGARIGIPGDNEAGLSFTGRALRVDARHAFESGSFALSIGAGGNVIWRGMDPVGEGNSMFHVRHGYGFDVPVLVGWQSDAGVVSIWGGARGGLETIGAWVSTEVPPNSADMFPMVLLTDVAMLRRYVGGVAGLSMGLRHVHVVLELDVLYQAVSGNLADLRVRVDGITLTPAGALLFTF